MAQPKEGDRITYKAYHSGNQIDGTVDWVGSIQFSVIPDNTNNDPREMIFFSSKEWKPKKS